MDDDYLPKKKKIHISTNDENTKRHQKRKLVVDKVVDESNKNFEKKKKTSNNYKKKVNNNSIGKNTHYNSNNTRKTLTRKTPVKRIENNTNEEVKKIVTPQKKKVQNKNVKVNKNKVEKIKVQEEVHELKNDIEPKNEILGDNIKKQKTHKRFMIVLIVVLVLSSIGAILFFNISKKMANDARILKEHEEEALITRIKSHYDKEVKTVDDAKIYALEDGNLVERGKIYSGVSVRLEELEEFDTDTKYFKIENKDFYLAFQDVIPNDEVKEETKLRYKRYIPFNENIVTKEHFTLYNDTQKLYSFDVSMEFPIIIKDFENKYYVEYDSMLLNIDKDDVAETKYSQNTNLSNQSRVTTLAYHRIYKPGESCTDPYVCMKQDNFDLEMKYLKENNYFTLTMQEFYMYLNGNLQVNNAVVLTFDDGLLMTNAIETLEKYDLDGTVFVITSVFFNYDYFASKNLYVQSHGDDLHRAYVCKGGQRGGAILCENEESIKNDLRTSVEKTGNPPYAFAYPFYDYNDRAIRILKDLGFKMAFAGRMNTMGRSAPHSVDLYKIPRMTVWELSIMSFNTWKSYL